MDLRNIALLLDEVARGEFSYAYDDFFAMGNKFHSLEACRLSREQGSPEHCFIHNPSNHHMRDWPMVIRSSSLIERTCEHGVGHPDPDSARFLNWRDGSLFWGVHGCDGCCVAKENSGATSQSAG